jgi:MoaA/NifB/PqqE/SkfB family radical SAM enzyme
MPPNKRLLDIKEKLNQKTVQQFVRDIDWQTSSVAPFVVELDPTTNCNLACPECISGQLLNQAHLESTRIKALIHELIAAGVKGVILIGGGEPMMHPDIGWIIQALGEAGIHIGITTNGLYLKKYQDIASVYAKWVRVSVDAGSSETFRKLRPSRYGKSLFDTVIDNMRAFARTKQGQLGYSFMVYSHGDHGFKNISITGNAKNIDLPTNAHEIFQAAQQAREIGCDYFEVKPMYDMQHFAVMPQKWIAEIVMAQLEQAKQLETASFKVVEAVKLRAALDGVSNLEPKNYSRCAVAQLRTLITPSGVYVCPYFRGVTHKKLGDIRDTSFSEMWRGSQRARVMAQLDPSRDCPMHCIRHESNLALEQAIREGFDFSSGTVDDYDFFI